MGYPLKPLGLIRGTILALRRLYWKRRYPKNTGPISFHFGQQ
jgi:hypothetical protein